MLVHVGIGLRSRWRKLGPLASVKGSCKLKWPVHAITKATEGSSFRVSRRNFVPLAVRHPLNRAFSASHTFGSGFLGRCPRLRLNRPVGAKSTLMPSHDGRWHWRMCDVQHRPDSASDRRARSLRARSRSANDATHSARAPPRNRIHARPAALKARLNLPSRESCSSWVKSDVTSR